MKKYWLILVFSLLGMQFLPAQLLWKISGKGLKKPSYLFGTHHLIPISFLDSVPNLYQAFNSCDVVVGEMVMDNIDASSKIQQAAIMPNHTKISNLITDSIQYQFVDKELKRVLKMGLKELSTLNPTMILTMYEMELYKKATGYTDNKQSDSFFQLVAAQKGKKVIGLENIDQQISILFGNGTLKRQAQVLVETLHQKDSVLQEIIHVNNLYKKGDLKELWLLSNRKGNVIDMTDDEYANLVDDRNADWVKRLPYLMQNSPCFIAVGALHLPGNKGLIKLLEDEGYRVSPERK